MQADVLEKLKDLICGHKPQLLAFFERLDATRTGAVSVGEWAEALRTVCNEAMPWANYVTHLATVEDGDRVVYREFLSR